MSSKKLSEGRYPFLPVDTGTVPANAPAGNARLWVDSDYVMRWVDATGAVYGAGGLADTGLRAGELVTVHTDDSSRMTAGPRLTISGTEPATPVNDDELWLDTSASPPVWKIRVAGEWVAVGGAAAGGGPEWQTADQEVNNITTGNTTSIPVDAPGNIAEGDLLVAVITGGLAGNVEQITAPTGWSSAAYGGGASVSGSAASARIWTKVATASEPASYEFTAEFSNQWRIVASRVTGASGVDANGGADTGGSNAASLEIPTVTAVGASLLVSAWATDQGSSDVTMTGPGSMTEVAKFDGEGSQRIAYVIAVEDVDDGATGGRTATCSPDGPWAGAQVAIGAA